MAAAFSLILKSVQISDLFGAKIYPGEIHIELCFFTQLCMAKTLAYVEQKVKNWCQLFHEGRTKIQDEQRSGWLSLITDDLVQKVSEKAWENRKFLVTDFSE